MESDHFEASSKTHILIPGREKPELNTAESHNIQLARRIVQNALNSGKLSKEDLNGKYFPQTTLLLTDLSNPDFHFNPKAAVAIEGQLVSVYSRLSTDFFSQQEEKLRRETTPKAKDYTIPEVDFIAESSDWLRKQIEVNLRL